jgi:hypothetical protein
MFISAEDKIDFFKKFWMGSIPYVIGLFVILNLFIFSWQHALEAGKKNNLLQNAKNYDPARIRFDLSVGTNTINYLRYIPDATKNNLVVITGMSQMYAINEEQPGDQTISEWLDDTLRSRGIRVFGIAAPNITNEEVLLILLSLVSEPAIHPKVFIYGVCFDKFRNIDLRPEYQEFIFKKNGMENIWENTSTEFETKYPLASQKMKSTYDALSEHKEESGIEGQLRSAAAAHLPFIKNIKDVNAWMQLEIFYLRNWLFHIKPSSKRPIIESRYHLNQQFLELLVDVAQKNNVKLVFYIVPLNPLAENPYLPEEYKKFKLWLGGLCQKRGIAFANLESVVPNDCWGEFMGGPDFKHFKGMGHKITADAVSKEFSNIFDKI